MLVSADCTITEYTQVHRKTVLVCWSIKTPQAPLTERGSWLKEHLKRE